MTFLPSRLTLVASLLAGLSITTTATADQAPANTIVLASVHPEQEMENNADDNASIISIDSAPATIEPLLKAIEQKGDPQRDLWERIRTGFALPELDTFLVREN